MHEVPIEIERQADRRDAELPSFEDDEEVDVVLETFRDLLHHIGLRAEQFVHPLETVLLGLDPQLGAEMVELLEVEFHRHPSVLY